MEQFYAYLAVTVGSVLVTAGVFLGSTKTTFRSLEKSIENLCVQIAEIRNDQKMVSELTTRIHGNEIKVGNLTKCQDHTTSELDRIQTRLDRLKGVE